MQGALRFFMIGAAVAFAGSLSDLATQENAPDTVVLRGSSAAGGVKFSHTSHQAMTECTACHHASRPEKPLSAPYQSCAECHTSAPSAPMKTSIRNAYHDAAAKAGTCMDCHVTEAAAGKVVPLGCTECHRKEAAPAASPGPARPLGPALRAADTPGSGDLRCLPGRPDDCLDRPVPRDGPHGARCVTCHNLWQPGVPANVTRSCTAAGCHAGASPLSVFHQTVHPEALSDCVHCHKAHEFRVPANGDDCSACHKSGGARVEWVTAATSHGLVAPSAFRHTDHGGVDCSKCHGTGQQHGTLEVVSLEDCRACHHRAPLGRDCARCHTPESVSGIALKVTRSLDIRIGSLDRPLRLLPFDHVNHLEIGCGRCHTQGSDLRAAAGADCSACHAQHHRPEADCSLCHQRPAAAAHDVQAHLGCSGTGCHDPAPEGIRGAPRTRALCLACHTDRRKHKPEQVCAECHRLPAPTGGS